MWDHPHAQHRLTAAGRESYRVGGSSVLNCVVLSWEEAEAGLETEDLEEECWPPEWALDWRETPERGWPSGAGVLRTNRLSGMTGLGVQVGASPAFGFWSHSSDAALSPLWDSPRTSYLGFLEPAVWHPGELIQGKLLMLGSAWAILGHLKLDPHQGGAGGMRGDGRGGEMILSGTQQHHSRASFSSFLPILK